MTKLPGDYISRRLVVLEKRTEAILVREIGERSKNIWLAKNNLIRGNDTGEEDSGFPIYSIVAQRWVFTEKGIK